MTSRRALLVGILVFLVASVAAILIVEGPAHAERASRSEAFQRLLGGIGFGAATDLASSAFDFDPRLESTSSQGHGAIPGGSCFSWRRGCGTLIYYPSLDPNVSSGEEAAGRADSP
jgi:hypothetical protein